MASSYNAQEEDCYIAVPVGPSIIKSPVTEFKQRLPAWQPILTAGTVLPAFFVIWFIVIPIGIGLYITSNIKDKECEPYACNENMPIVPSAAPFNQDLYPHTLALCYIDPNGTRIQIPLKGIAWWTDKHVKFSNPGGSPNLTSVFQGKQPINWRKPVYELDTDAENNDFINEDFIVWMRTAAFPIFCKLYCIIQKNVTPTLPRGNYTLEVTYNYPVRSFEGWKRNPFLGVAYITVGFVCFFLGVVLIHHKYGSRNHITIK
uniref:Cell cycle control protein n=1 Tax=Oncorhynchus tshawytscha TaxID=74940 RepID=A0A8C8FYT8_ONCTS